MFETMIAECQSLISQGANEKKDKESVEKYRDILARMNQLIRTLFSDAEVRLKEHQEMKSNAALRDTYLKTGEFVNQVKATKRFIEAIVANLEIRKTSEVKDSRLEKLEFQLGEKEIESKRREKVTETKFWGGAIELIDRLRNELKESSNVKADLVDMKRDIKEIKEILSSINKSPSDHSESTQK